MLSGVTCTRAIAHVSFVLCRYQVLRNVGVPLGHSIIALRSLLKGCGKVELNKAVVEKDLNAHWEVVAEAVQVRRRDYCLK